MEESQYRPDKSGFAGTAFSLRNPSGQPGLTFPESAAILQTK